MDIRPRWGWAIALSSAALSLALWISTRNYRLWQEYMAAAATARRSEDLPGAEAAYLKASRLAERLRWLGPRAGESHLQLAILYNRQGRLEEAARCFELAFRELRRSPQGRRYHQLVTALRALGKIRRDQGRREEAKAVYRELLGLQGRDLQAHPADLVSFYLTLASLHDEAGELAQAEAMYRQARTAAEAAWGSRDGRVGQALARLGAFYRKQGRPEDARKTLLQALELLEPAWGPEHAITRQAKAELLALKQHAPPATLK